MKKKKGKKKRGEEMKEKEKRKKKRKGLERRVLVQYAFLPRWGSSSFSST